jgi:hypothetical protein
VAVEAVVVLVEQHLVYLQITPRQLISQSARLETQVRLVV